MIDQKSFDEWAEKVPHDIVFALLLMGSFGQPDAETEQQPEADK